LRPLLVTQEQGPGAGFEEAPEAEAERLGLRTLPPGEVLLVIIGAGASYDCTSLDEHHASRRPPGRFRGPGLVRPPVRRVINFTELVRRCYRWARATDGRVCFVNFNYDFLLEHACADHSWLILDQIPTPTCPTPTPALSSLTDQSACNGWEGKSSTSTSISWTSVR